MNRAPASVCVCNHTDTNSEHKYNVQMYGLEWIPYSCQHWCCVLFLLSSLWWSLSFLCCFVFVYYYSNCRCDVIIWSVVLFHDLVLKQMWPMNIKQMNVEMSTKAYTLSIQNFKNMLTIWEAERKEILFQWKIHQNGPSMHTIKNRRISKCRLNWKFTWKWYDETTKQTKAIKSKLFFGCIECRLLAIFSFPRIGFLSQNLLYKTTCEIWMAWYWQRARNT